jgi:hypothetical protein
MLFVNIEIFNFILNFRINYLFCVSLDAGKLFWGIKFGIFFDYIVWKEFFIKIYIEISVILFGFRVLILVDVCWTGVCDV